MLAIMNFCRRQAALQLFVPNVLRLPRKLSALPVLLQQASGVPRRPLYMTALRRCQEKIKIDIIPAAEPPHLNYKERNLKKGRELSPHLSIYKPQLTSVLSILLRGSGLFMAFVVWSYGVVGLLHVHDIEDYANVSNGMDLNPKLLGVLKTMLVLPFAYHFCNGVRHLIWHTGLFLTKRQIYITGYVTLLMTAALTIYLVMWEGEDEECECDAEEEERKFGKENIESTLAELDIDIEQNAEDVSHSDAQKVIADRKTEEADAGTDEKIDKEKIVEKIKEANSSPIIDLLKKKGRYDYADSDDGGDDY